MRTTRYMLLHAALLVLSAGLLLGAMGCEEDAVAPPPPTTPEPKAKPAAKPKKVVENTDDKAYKRPEFLGEKRRDPFLFEPPKVQEGNDLGGDRPLEPLEFYGVQELRLVAIVTGTSVPKAMFTDPSGHGHMAKEGDRIGRDGGRIAEIRNNEVEVTTSQENTLEQAEDNGTEESEKPTTIVIRLSDTELALEPENEESENILEQIKPEGQGQRPTESPNKP